MRIGVEATCWHNTRGFGRHIRALLPALVGADRDNSYTLFLDAPPEADGLPAGADVQMVQATAPAAVAASANGRRSLADMWRLSRALAKSQSDVLFFPSVYSFVPVLSRARKVVMIHDVIAEKYPHLTLPSRASRLFWKAKSALGRWQADAVVTISEHARRGIVEHFRMPAERVHVVGMASDPVFRVLPQARLTARLRELGLTETARLVVYVGGFSPHKNLELLVAAFATVAARPEFADTSLVLVGEYHKEVFHSCFSAVQQQVQHLGLARRVIFTGYLPDDEVVVLLNRAAVLALPSLLEGFGLPAVEAAACGCPVLATTASPLPALLGEGGRFLDPLDRGAWEQALIEVLGSKDLRRQMSEAGQATARRLTWDVAAQQFLTVLRKVVA
jgi:glycosyltransferase involved in cell wall biosynthesis